MAAAGGDAALYDKFLARVAAPGTTPEEYYRFFNTLAAFRDPALVSRTLMYAVSPDVRSQDTPLLLGQLLGSPASQDAAWRFVKDQWPVITGKLGTFQGVPGVMGAMGAFCAADRAAEVTAFFKANPVPAAARILQQSIERITSCAAVDTRQSPAFTRWLETKK